MVPVVTGARLSVLEGLSTRLEGAGEDPRAGSGPLEDGGTGAAAGAGEFVVSWVGVLGTCSQAGELISDGVGDFVVGVRGADRRASREVIAL
jgi:hypothetical protein